MDFWNVFSVNSEDSNIPWLCIGDLNHILSQSEKLGGQPYGSPSSCPFRSFIDRFGLIDLGFTGNPYTWSNNREGNDIIKECLDRALASSQWVHQFPSYYILHIPAFFSDHNPIFLNTYGTSPPLPRPFRFEEFWTRNPTCGQIIDAAWNRVVQGNPAFCLVKKLKYTKAALKSWNTQYFGNIQRNIKVTLKQIDSIQQGPHTLASSTREAFLKSDLEDLLIKEELLWRNKSRETWLTCKDLNTRFFHTFTIIRRRSNAVDFIKTESGDWLSDRTSIRDNFVNHFSSIFATSLPPIDGDLLSLFNPVILAEDNVFLCAMPLEEEVVQALFSIGSTKAPGPDGFTAFFFKKYWSTVKIDMLGYM